ncbi:MAG TPA: hypothetical protein VLE97_00355 [Gaiellaceae bacterium]|nr:hypothetical protein [Gaiellaceae bacterium]
MIEAMSEIERPSDDILIVNLSAYHSLDLVRVPTTQKYRIVLAERLGVQRRAFVEISYDQAREIASFLGAADLDVASITDPAPPHEESPAEELPPPPIPPRTRTRGT